MERNIEIIESISKRAKLQESKIKEIVTFFQNIPWNVTVTTFDKSPEYWVNHFLTFLEFDDPNNLQIEDIELLKVEVEAKITLRIMMECGCYENVNDALKSYIENKVCNCFW